MPTRVERHRIRPSSPWFPMLKEFCHLAKNLYNHANYLMRQQFLQGHRQMGYSELDKALKADGEYPDYRAMPTAQSAQQVLRLLCKNWKAFSAASRDWKQHREKYLGRPKLPKYKKKDGLSILVMTNQNCRLEGSILRFPKTFRGFEARPKFVERPFVSFQQVRFVPDGTGIWMEIVYTIADIPQPVDNGNYAGIDLGVGNLATVATNTGHSPLLVRGSIPKSVNQYYNKELARRKSICQQASGHRSSKRIRQLTAKRNRRIEDYMHKASRRIVEECARRNVSVIVIGQNKGWKQESALSGRVNQHFVQLPFARLIQMIQYKAEEKGMAVILTEESYTSGTSFLDGELPTKENYDKKRRIHRGLFRTNQGHCIHADVNGAFQIMRKVFPNVTADGIEGVVLRPVVVVAA